MIQVKRVCEGDILVIAQQQFVIVNSDDYGTGPGDRAVGLRHAAQVSAKKGDVLLFDGDLYEVRLTGMGARMEKVDYQAEASLSRFKTL